MNSLAITSLNIALLYTIYIHVYISSKWYNSFFIKLLIFLYMVITDGFQLIKYFRYYIKNCGDASIGCSIKYV